MNNTQTVSFKAHPDHCNKNKQTKKIPKFYHAYPGNIYKAPETKQQPGKQKQNKLSKITNNTPVW